VPPTGLGTFVYFAGMSDARTNGDDADPAAVVVVWACAPVVIAASAPDMTTAAHTARTVLRARIMT
jgi:hypothetical protein